MHRLLKKFQDVCAEFRWQEKLLLAPTKSQGHMLLEALARSGAAWLNLRPVTMMELAYSAAQTDLRYRHLHLMDEVEQLRLVKQVIDSLGEQQKLNYFYELYRLGKLEPWICSSINELRMAGISADDLTRSQQGLKAAELGSILSAYEGRLEEFLLVDQAELYRRAAAYTEQNSELWLKRKLLIPDQLELPWLAQELLQAIPASSCICLPQQTVMGINTPPRFRAFNDISSGCQRNESFEPIRLCETTVEFIPAYGRSNEIYTALRRIIAGETALDTAVLVYTDTTAYARLAYSITSAHNIPAAFAAGIPLDTTNPGRLCLLLLEWMESRYSAGVFYHLLMDGYLNQDFPSAAGQIWLDASLTGGKDSYLKGLLDWYAWHQERDDDYEKVLPCCQILIDFCTSLLSVWGEPLDDSGVNFALLCSGLAECLRRFAKQENDADQETLTVLERILRQYEAYFDQPVSLSRGLHLLREIITNQSVMVSGPRPGKLFVCHYSEAEWCDRRHTFIVGLDADTFPGSQRQDPIILDEERLALSDKLPLNTQSANEKTYRLARLLASRRGQLTMVFSCYDPSSFRSLLPSSLVLQVYRQVSDCRESDYSMLQQALPLPENFLPRNSDQVLGNNEWWGYSWLGTGGTWGWNDTLTACYPGTARGLYAEEQRNSSVFTPFDGSLMLGREPSAVRTVSASGLEAAARCPFAYFLRYVLKLTPAMDSSAELDTWLDPLQMGSLLHEVYCRYGRQQVQSSQWSLNDLRDMTRQLVSSWRDLVPVNNELAYTATGDEIMRGLEVFYNLYHKAEPDSKPAFFEVPFGFGEDEVRAAGAGCADPIRIELPGGRIINLRGRIDRIDRPLVGKGYRVWDYKTGGHSQYSELGNVKKGRQLQHLLYAAALQKMLDQGLDPGAYVETAGYLFPTRRGEGQIITRVPEKRGRGMEAVSLLCSIIAGGKFGCRHNDEECKYCDYTVVCRFPQGNQQMAMMMSNDCSEALQEWKELQEYD